MDYTIFGERKPAPMALVNWLLVATAHFLRMLPNETLRRLAFAAVEDGLRRNSNDVVILTPDELDFLRKGGWIDGHTLEDKAFLEFFELFPGIEPPDEVREFAEYLGVTGIHYKRAQGDVLGDNRSFPGLKYIFIREGAPMASWYHELGHLLYASVKALVPRLIKEAKLHYRIVDGDGRTVLDPFTREPIPLPPGRYIEINGAFRCFSHHGAEGGEDEWWANFFGEHSAGNTVATPVAVILESIVEKLHRTASK